MGHYPYVLWGLLPLYWKLVSDVSPYQVFGQRVVWSFLFVTILPLIRKQWSEFLAIIRDKREWVKIIGPEVFISLR